MKPYSTLRQWAADLFEFADGNGRQPRRPRKKTVRREGKMSVCEVFDAYGDGRLGIEEATDLLCDVNALR